MEPLQVDDPERLGPYRLIGRLGAGGMGRVFMAVTPEGRQAAVKVIRDELAADPAFRHRFRREVSAAASVAGMFTARVLDADPDADRPWLATEFVDGPSLRDAVARSGPLAEPALLGLATGLAEALGAIHAAGLVHRDLKPANVLLARTGPKVIDFGIARAADSTRLTGTGEAIGTPEYMAPEQVTGEGGPAADVFALGSTLAYAATGRSPFAADHPAAILYRIVHGEPDLGGMPAAATDLVRSCLATDPARRPTAQQLAARLRAGGPAPAAATRLSAVDRGGTGAPGGTSPTRAGRRRAVAVAGLAAVAAAAGVTAVLVGLPTGGGAPPAAVTATGSPATGSPLPASAPPVVDPTGQQARYVERLCTSGHLLVSLGESATVPQPAGDPAVVKRDFLAAVDRTIAVIDVALPDFTVLRDDAPNREIGERFGLVVDEFTSARGAFVDARDRVASSEPLDVASYRAGLDHFTDGTRSIALAAQTLPGVTLPADYQAAADVAASCAG